MNHNNNEKLHQLQRKLHISQFNRYNHLLSIIKDSNIINLLYNYLSSYLSIYLSNCQLFANLRNGIWYRDHFHSTCYFKSTDGHVNQWKFSIKRLNLHVIKCCIEKLVIIVDSTRQGKRFPDSMTFTIPVWCAVINALMFGITNHNLQLPDYVSESITSQITNEIPNYLCSLSQSMQSYIKLQLINLTKPLVPLWICPTEDDSIDWLGSYSENFIDSLDNIDSLNYIPILLLSCSSSYEINQNDSWHYIQGAGDDEEFWARGLTSQVFWDNKDSILSSNDPFVVDQIIDSLVNQLDNRILANDINIATIGDFNIHIMKLINTLDTTTQSTIYDGLIVLTDNPTDTTISLSTPSIYITTPSNKKDWSVDRHHWSDRHIDMCISFYQSLASDLTKGSPSILILYDDLQQCCIAVLVLMIRFNLMSLSSNELEDLSVKALIQLSLTNLQNYLSSANPNRRDMKELIIYFTRQSIN